MIVRRSRTAAGASIAACDTELAEPVRIGRSQGCGIRIVRPGMAFLHASLTSRGGTIRVEAAPDAMLGPQIAPLQSAILSAPGDTVRVGTCRVTLLAPVDGMAAVEITEDEVIAERAETRAERHFAAFDTRLPNVRLLGTSLAAAILALLFVLPLATSSVGGRADAHRTGVLSALAEPGRALWVVGAMSHAHAGLGADCGACHKAAFAHAASQSCLACHGGIGQHASPLVAPAADLRGVACEHCHLEHKGPVMAARDRQPDCTACHANIAGAAPRTALRNVGDFTVDHPQFKVALVQDAVLRRTARFSVGDADAPDHSNLRFTHATHLKLADLRAPPGGSACARCHVAAGGVGFRKVEFEPACASCHTLQFDPDHPDWRLPHGHPGEVAGRVAGYYARAVLAGESFFRPPADLFRKPGAPPDPPPARDAALVSAMTAQAMASSIARSACGECHTVNPPAAGADAAAWTVAPVMVPDSYQPSTKFSHAAHAASACTLCHAASASDGGPTLLLPGIETCRTCHAGEAGAAQRVASTCVFCHRFHDDTLPLLPAVAPQAAVSVAQSRTEVLR